MRKLWQAVLEAQKVNEGADIFLDVTDTSSPYGEATLKNVYTPDGPAECRIAVNPYYSYEAIFAGLIKPGKVPDITVFLCDLILHHLFEIDVLEGMNREEFYIRFLEEDIEQGAFGVFLTEDAFTQKQRRRIACYYLRLCRTGCFEECFCGILQEFYKKSWASLTESGSLIVVMGIHKTDREERRVRSLQDIFLPAAIKRRIYWGEPPCIIGCEQTPVGQSVLF